MAALTFDHLMEPQGGPAPPSGSPSDGIPAPKGALTFDHLLATPEPQGPPIPAPAEAPWYAQAGQAADDLARLAGNGLTFGFADKFAGYMSGTGTEAERAKTAQAAERAGIPGTIAQYGAAAAAPLGAARAGLTALRAVPSGLGGIAGASARTVAMGAEGAGYGALSAAGHDQDIATGAKLGALTGTAGSVLSTPGGVDALKAFASGAMAAKTGGLSGVVGHVVGEVARNRVYGLARVVANGGAATAPIQNAIARLPQAERDALARILMSWGVEGGLSNGAGAALP